MKLAALLIILIPAIGWALPQARWEDYLREEVLPAQEHFEDLRYLKPWKIDSDFVIDATQLVINKRESSFRCQTDHLWPSHPYQSTKEYHAALRAEYDYTRLPVSSSACMIPNPTRRFCQRAAAAKLVITSDLYVDDCGNHYRAYWLTAYQSNFESMGTLFAKGRTAYERPGSSVRGDYVTGETYGINKKEFLYLTPLSVKDQRNLSQSLQGIEIHFLKRGRLFIPR